MTSSVQVLVFLDAHVEVNEGWVEPLLELIRADRTTLAVPRVDAIDPLTLSYSAWNYEVSVLNLIKSNLSKTYIS